MASGNFLTKSIHRAYEIYAYYLLYALLAPVFLSFLAISNFQHKPLLIAGLWIAILLDKNYIKVLFCLLENQRAMVLAAVSLSTYVSCVSYILEAEVNNFLVAGALIAWIPACAIAASEFQRHKERTLVGLYLTCLLAALMIATLLAWQRYLIGAERPLGIGHNVISGPLICALSILCNELASRSTTLSTINTKIPFIRLTSALLAVSSLITDSRTALLCAVISVFYIMSNNIKNLTTNKALSLAAVATLIAAYHEKFVNALSDITGYLSGNLNSSIGGRFEAYAWSFKHFDEHIWIGKTLEGVKTLFNSRYDDTLKSIEFMPHLHNDFLQLTAAFGLPTALMFGIFLGLLYFKSGQGKKNISIAKRQSVLFTDGLQPTILCIIIVSWFDSLTYNTESLLAFMIIVGISLAVSSRCIKDPS